jgi:hypothetical protein
VVRSVTHRQVQLIGIKAVCGTVELVPARTEIRFRAFDCSIDEDKLFGRNNFWKRHQSEDRLMPTYYFQLQTGASVVEDPEGSELPDLQTARLFAVESARELVAHAIKWNHSVPDRVLVVDGNGRELLTVFTTEVIPDSLKEKFR